TFGEVLDQMDGEQNAQTILLPDISSWKQQGEVTLEERDGVATISTGSFDDGVIIPFAAGGNEVYSLSMEYRSAVPLAIRIWNVDGQLRKVGDITLYNDGVPESPGAWSDFRTTVFVPGLQGPGCA